MSYFLKYISNTKYVNIYVETNLQLNSEKKNQII